MFSGPAAISINSTTINAASRAYKHQGHIQFLQNNHSICNQIITNPSFDGQPVTHPPQKELTALPRRCSQLAYWNCHYKRHQQHQNTDKQINCYSIITTRNPSTYHIGTECHQICCSGQQTQHQHFNGCSKSNFTRHQ